MYYIILNLLAFGILVSICYILNWTFWLLLSYLVIYFTYELSYLCYYVFSKLL